MSVLKLYVQFSFEMSTRCLSGHESEIRDFVYDGGSVAAEVLSHRSSDPEVEKIVLVEPQQPLRRRATAAGGVPGWAAK
jgi:hypothetical protein